VIDDELERLRRANPVQHRTGERLSAPHTAAFRAAIEAPSHRRGLTRAATSHGPRHESRLALVAAAVALVALPATLLTRSDNAEIIVRTPTTNESLLDGDETLPTTLPAIPTTDPTTVRTTVPITREGGLRPTATTVQEPQDDLTPTVDDAPTPPSTTTSDATTTTQAVSATTVATTQAPGSASLPATPPTPSPPSESASEPATDVADTTPPTKTETAPAASSPANTSPANSSPANTSPANSSPATTQPDSPSTTTTTAAPEPSAQRSIPATSGPFDPTTDLLMVTFDFAHLDDAHATVATHELVTTYDVAPIVVAGTAAPESAWFTHEYDEAMSAAWGTSWLDAGDNRSSAVTDATNQWLATIDAGGEVWIAEGGVSDFTAAVLVEVRAQRPTLDSSAVVHVIRHSSRNWDATQPADRQLIEAHTDIVDIDDGNLLNDTADLQGPSNIFEQLALAGPSADAWTTAFELMPASELDFSDTVTVLHALGVGLDVIADADDFAAVTMT